MRRRDFIAGGLATAGGLAAPHLRAQPDLPQYVKRAAVVIGVDKAGQLPPLNAAASGANDVAQWLTRERFDYIKPFVDAAGPVRLNDILDVISALVQRDSIQQLVIYFAGHGLLRDGADEVWLLSLAPDYASEAIALTESARFARETTIKHVVFISDACRSLPGDSLALARVRGNPIFPNPSAHRQARGDVDKFFATLPGYPSYEGPISDKVSRSVGYYTECFLDAFEKPDADMILTLPDGERVVPNRHLRAYLEREVPRRASEKSIARTQIPDAEIMSDEKAYIGRVPLNVAPTQTVPAPRQATYRDLANLSLAGTGLEPLTVAFTGELLESSAEFEFKRVQSTILAGSGQPRRKIVGGEFPVSRGYARFFVSGRQVESVITNPGISARLNLLYGSIEVDLREKLAASIAVRFADGSGTVLAALKGYTGNVVVDRGVIASVSYVPISIESEPDSVVQLRAAVATAAQFGVLRIEGDREDREQKARTWGDTIRIQKKVDPTLGLYAAYAYDQADLLWSVRSVRNAMSRDLLGINLFDVAMLSDDPDTRRVVPFCPMLSQGWALLRVKRVRLPRVVELARDYLRPALWTTFNADGMEMISRELRAGELQ
jgi:hypothetical protein